MKCTECGNTFQKEGSLTDNQLISCPVCEANYRAVVTDGKIRLEDFVFEEKDLGEL